MELIPNWKNAWKMSSVIILALLTVFDLSYAALPDLKPLIDPALFASINTAASIAAIVGRVIKQSLSVTPEVKEQLMVHVESLPEKAQ